MTASKTRKRRKKNPRTFTHHHRQRFVRVVEHHLHHCFQTGTPVRGKDLADSLGLRPEYVSWLAVQILGEPLQDYFRKRQVAYAETMLRTSSLTIEEVAVRRGFGTRGTMNRWFRKVHGMSAARFRGLKK